MGSMIIGFSTAYTSPALVKMSNSTDITITTEEVKIYVAYCKQLIHERFQQIPNYLYIFQASWVGGLMPLAALAGGLLGGPLVDYIGRRKTILFSAPPFFLGWILIATARIVPLVLAGRALCGLCVGVGSLAYPVYLAETIHAEVRGTLGLFPTTLGNIGILVCYIVGKYVDWYHLAYLGSMLTIPFFILMFLIPETPRWYLLHGKTEEARKALQWLRGKNAKIEKEMGELSGLSDETDESENGLKEVFSRKYRKSILTSIGLMAFQQLSGINAVIFYTVQIFQMSGSAVEENLSTIIVGIVNIVSIFIATALIDRLGRKILLYLSSVTMTVTVFTLGTFFYVRDVMNINVDELGWLPLTSLMLYLLGFSLGFGPIPWLMMGEILPAKIRGPAASICTAFNWLCTFLVTKTFQNILDNIGPHGTFWLFGSICFVGLFFVIVFVPETRGKSLEQIENNLTGRRHSRSRRMSSIANIKPMPMGC